MLARGFTGRLPEFEAPPFAFQDALFLVLSAAAAVAIRLFSGAAA